MMVKTPSFKGVEFQVLTVRKYKSVKCFPTTIWDKFFYAKAILDWNVGFGFIWVGSLESAIFDVASWLYVTSNFDCQIFLVGTFDVTPNFDCQIFSVGTFDVTPNFDC